MDKITITLNNILTLTPMIIIWLIGIGLALARWRQHPQVSLFTLIAFVVMIGATVAVRFVSTWASLTLSREYGWTQSSIGTFYTAINVAFTLISAAAWALVLCAIFGWRATPRKEHVFTPAPPGFSQQ